MRLYNKKFAKNFVDRRVLAHTETRDAVLWDINVSNHYCKVRIQGSNEDIIAHFPRNWTAIPYWLKKGNAVRILFKQGIRGYIEVIGEGRAIPTPTSGNDFPDPATLPDIIISGLKMTAMAVPSMNLQITDGSFRINEVVYSVGVDEWGGIIMDDPASIIMGDAIDMGDAIYTATVDAAPALGYFRYDAFVIGEDKVIDYLKGTEVQSDPVFPTIPTDHLLIGRYIFVRSEVTEIKQLDIGAQWSAQVPSKMVVTYSNGTGVIDPVTRKFEWNTVEDVSDIIITIEIFDQWGSLMTPIDSYGFIFEIEIMYGTGLVKIDSSVWGSSARVGTVNSSVVGRYQRDQGDTEHSPALKINFSATSCNMGTGEFILLTNSIGGVIS